MFLFNFVSSLKNLNKGPISGTELSPKISMFIVTRCGEGNSADPRDQCLLCVSQSLLRPAIFFFLPFPCELVSSEVPKTLPQHPLMSLDT